RALPATPPFPPKRRDVPLAGPPAPPNHCCGSRKPPGDCRPDRESATLEASSSSPAAAFIMRFPGPSSLLPLALALVHVACGPEEGRSPGGGSNGNSTGGGDGVGGTTGDGGTASGGGADGSGNATGSGASTGSGGDNPVGGVGCAGADLLC